MGGPSESSNERNDEFSADLVTVPYELRPSIPSPGVSASEKGLRRSERVEAKTIEIAAAEGETMVIPDLMPDTHLAMVPGENGRGRGEDAIERCLVRPETVQGAADEDEQSRSHA